METLWSDVKHGMRMLLNNPGFAVVAVLTLSIGIGANTAAFSLVNAVLIRGLPLDDPDRIVAVYTSDFSSGRFSTSSFPDYLDIRESTSSLADLAAVRNFVPMSLNTGGETQRLVGAVVTGNYFSLLRVQPAVGRFFGPGNDTDYGSDPSAVLSHDLWRRSFAADPEVVGTDIILNGYRFTIIGVAPRGFRGTDLINNPALWVPMSMIEQAQPRRAGDDILSQRGSRWLGMVGRMSNSATVEQTQAELDGIAAQLARDFPSSNLGTLRAPDDPRPLSVLFASDALLGGGNRGDAEQVAGFLLGVVGFVLLIVCANVANLLLSRSAQRRQEIAVRQALGAGRGRLLRQMLTESLVIALLGGAVGLMLATWLRDATLATNLPGSLGLGLTANELALDRSVLAFSLLVSLGAGIVFGVLPALRSTRSELVPALKEVDAGLDGGRRILGVRNLLVVVQVALSLVLLVGAGLFLRSLQNALRMDLGFETGNVLLANLDLSLQRYERPRGDAFYDELLERTRALPGVTSASLAMAVPVNPGGSRMMMSVEGYEPADGEDMELNYNIVSPDYFETIGIGLVRGRTFVAGDTSAAEGALVVNETFASHFWPGLDPIERVVYFGRSSSAPRARVVGVVSDGKYRSIREEPMPYVYRVLGQGYSNRMTLLLLAETEPATLLASVRAQVASLDPDLPVFSVRTLEDQVSSVLVGERTAAVMLGVLGTTAMLFAAVGIYGVISQSVQRRTHEIGLRIALGASAPDVLRMVVGQGMMVVGIGLVVGIAGAFALTRAVAALLFGVSATDPVAFVGVPIILCAVALVACILPARRATRIDPLVALRYE